VPDPSGLQLRIDGALTTLGPQGLALGAGGRVAPAAGGALEVDFPDGATLLATPEWWASQGKWYLNVDLSHLGLVSDVGGTSGRGIAGAIANGSWLPALPDGASLGPMPASLPERYDVLYEKFADAWRVNNRDSLFDYAPGTSTNTYTMKDWPKQNPPCIVRDEKPVEPASEASAVAACRGVRDENRRADCVFDVRVTGNLGFAKTYVDTQRNLAFSTTTSLTDGDNPSQAGEWVTFTAFVAPYFSAVTGFPSGTVQFAVDDWNSGEPVTVDAKGRATWETSRLKVGTHQVTASYVPGAGSAFLPSASLEKIHEVVRCFCDAAHKHK
jgi:Bacterial Ig-like domain (group 3)